MTERLCLACQRPFTRRSDAVYCGASCSHRTPCKGCGSLMPRPRNRHYCLECRPLNEDGLIPVRRPCCGKLELVTTMEYPAKSTSACKPCYNKSRTLDQVFLPLDAEGTCKTCGLLLPAAAFKKTKTGRLSLTRCLACTKKYHHAYRLETIYGITPEMYDAMLEAQGGGCFLCGKRQLKHKLAVDHNHKTGEVRGLLCKRCNHRLLGSANDDPAKLRKAADYLDNPPAREVLARFK